MWVGQCNVLAGDRIVGIGWGDDAAAEALRGVCARWPFTGPDHNVPVALGVRSVAVGLRRRRLWLVHHGTPVRHRSADLGAAARFVDGVLASLATPLGQDDVALPFRAYTKAGRAVLVHVPDEVDLDERPLHKRGIEQLAALTTVMRPATTTVAHASGDFELVGAVIDHHVIDEHASLDDARRHLMAWGAGERAGWAWAIERLGQRIAVANDPADEIRRLLG